jgi:hypothetical protein
MVVMVTMLEVPEVLMCFFKVVRQNKMHFHGSLDQFGIWKVLASQNWA